jgi:hypothetical protein
MSRVPTTLLAAPLLAALLVGAIASPAAAQDVGGLHVAPGMVGGPSGLARPLPFVLPSIGASDVQASLKATDRSARHQALVARTRGDAGYLGGFSMGTPLSASVQKVPRGDGSGYYGYGGHGGRRPVIVNNTFEGPVAITHGSGNVVQQQSASGPGPIALQQVTNGQGGVGSGGGAVNTVLPGGNIVQHGGR